MKQYLQPFRQLGAYLPKRKKSEAEIEFDKVAKQTKLDNERYSKEIDESVRKSREAELKRIYDPNLPSNIPGDRAYARAIRIQKMNKELWSPWTKPAWWEFWRRRNS
jgi:hypothetical protein